MIPRRWTRNQKPRNPKPETPYPQVETRRAPCSCRATKCARAYARETHIVEHRNQNSETPTTGTRNPKPETRNPKIRNSKPETPYPQGEMRRAPCSCRSTKRVRACAWGTLRSDGSGSCCLRTALRHSPATSQADSLLNCVVQMGTRRVDGRS